ncbi:hypothetical protein CLOACE_08180 [Clostridium acetireducens DSM 10703]|uniref:Anti-bacteriophage protein A/HamA C-terminal domain-containing protein n=1 Tax=Clostridium acetireducens DSM 10703 TaxID=1121290 RepID=A0A1E8EZT8_9CLOT|nr:Hachiman antiphage defense system protein HamA [Clostridium acetireducens]OFI06663.1 hypothetical protein CLOACE_08180 [Clostridium acetireducens DSM 10703]
MIGTKQDKMIGKHPIKNSIFADWLICNDMDCTEKKIHRSLIENSDCTDQAIEEIAKWLINFHLTRRKKDLLDKKKVLLKKYEFHEYADSLHIFPLTDKTQKGNLGEVILTQYLHDTSGIDIVFYKLRYNPNVDQSMKGDDVLLVDDKKILLGESKFRKKAGKNVVDEISKNFATKLTLPISLSFIADRLYDEGNHELSDKISEIETVLSKGKIDIKNIGFILSDYSAHVSVEKHMNSQNKDFIMITLNVDNVLDLLNKSFERAKEKIKGDFPYEY